MGREGRLLARWRVQEQDDGDNEADCDKAVVSRTLELFDHRSLFRLPNYALHAPTELKARQKKK